VLSVSPQIVTRHITTPPTRVVTVSGEHDRSTVQELERVLRIAVASGDPAIVDLRRTTFADSAILAAVVRAHHRAGRRRFAVLVPPSGEVARLFELTDARAVLVTLPALRMAIDWCYPTGRPELTGARRYGLWPEDA
jgi:anti-anti-sigma factor